MRRRADSTSEPYSTNVSGSHRSSMFSRAVRWPVARRRATAFGRAASKRAVAAVQHLLQVGADEIEIDRLLLDGAAAEFGALLDEGQRMAFEHGVACARP